MSTPLEIQKEQRLRLLRRLYEHTGGDTAAMISMWAIGRELGLSEEETRRVVQYLVDENLAKYRAIGGWIGITHRGVKEVEATLQEPGQPTHHFPAAVPAAINVLVIEEMGYSLRSTDHYMLWSATVIMEAVHVPHAVAAPAGERSYEPNLRSRA